MIMIIFLVHAAPFRLYAASVRTLDEIYRGGDTAMTAPRAATCEHSKFMSPPPPT